MTDLTPADAFDPTTASLPEFLAEHGIQYDQDGNAILCKCGWSEDNGIPLQAHLFEASRSIMYRESAAWLQNRGVGESDELAAGLYVGFQLMLSQAEAYQLGTPGLGYDNDTTASV